MEKAVIVSAYRTAIGSFGGALKDLPAVDISIPLVRGILTETGVTADEVDEIIMGCVIQAGLGQNAARQLSVRAGLPVKTPAMTINQVCGSGLRSIALAAQAIQTGDRQIVLAGGMENMSRAPFLLHEFRWGRKMGHADISDSMLLDALTDAFSQTHMGITAENIAETYGISRTEQDEFAACSQQKAEQAIKDGIFKNEILPVEIPQKRGDPIIFDIDEYPRFGTTAEKLGKLSPAFKPGGTVTAGNSSGINDGAAMVMVMAESRARASGLRPMAEIVSAATTGVDPSMMGMGPVDSSRIALRKANLDIGELVLIELNEAFAAQSIAVVRKLGADPRKVNVNGGAIALGHPVGASGARILTTLLHELKRRNGRFGLASLCIGGGMGISVIVKNLS